MKQFLYCSIGMVVGSILSSWTLSYGPSWSFQHNDHSLTNAVEHIFHKVHNLNYISVGNNDDYLTRDHYECLMSSGFTDSVRFKVGDTVFMYYGGGHDVLWNSSERHPTYYQTNYSEHERSKKLPPLISKYMIFFSKWDSISARDFHNSRLLNAPDSPDSPFEITRFIITRTGMRIDGFEY